MSNPVSWSYASCDWWFGFSFQLSSQSESKVLRCGWPNCRPRAKNLEDDPGICQALEQTHGRLAQSRVPLWPVDGEFTWQLASWCREVLPGQFQLWQLPDCQQPSNPVNSTNSRGHLTPARHTANLPKVCCSNSVYQKLKQHWTLLFHRYFVISYDLSLISRSNLPYFRRRVAPWPHSRNGVTASAEVQHVVLRAEDYGPFGFMEKCPRICRESLWVVLSRLCEVPGMTRFGICGLVEARLIRRIWRFTAVCTASTWKCEILSRCLSSVRKSLQYSVFWSQYWKARWTFCLHEPAQGRNADGWTAAVPQIAIVH